MPKTSLKAPKGATAQLAALKRITADERRNVVEELDQRWCAQAFNFLQRAEESTEAGKSFDARNWTWAAGVATDKVFAIREIPTQIVANLHEHRHDLSGIADKLLVAAKVLETHRKRGFQQVSAQVVQPVPHLALDQSNVAARKDQGRA